MRAVKGKLLEEPPGRKLELDDDDCSTYDHSIVQVKGQKTVAML